MIIYILWVNDTQNRARLYIQDSEKPLERVLKLRSKKFRENSTTYGPHFYADTKGIAGARQVEDEIRRIYGDKIKQVVEF